MRRTARGLAPFPPDYYTPAAVPTPPRPDRDCGPDPIATAAPVATPAPIAPAAPTARPRPRRGVPGPSALACYIPDPMARKQREPVAAARLEALIRVGDMGAARAEARRLLADPDAGDAPRRAAEEALGRARPDIAAAVAAAAGIAFFLTVALLGLLSHR